VNHVLTTIVTRAVEMSAADGGSIFELESGEFLLRACSGTSDELEQSLREIRIRLGESFIGRAARGRKAMQSSDLDREPPDPHIDELRRHGWRSMVVLPLPSEHEIIGALVVRRKRPGLLSARTVELLETLAS
jgi:signal transduction protein with GAF and PtsI domain